MAIRIPVDTRIENEYAMIEFDFCEKPYVYLFQEAIQFVEDLRKTHEKTKIKFTNVAAVRTILINKGSNFFSTKIDYGVTFWQHEGSLNSTELLRMMRYPSKISSENWLNYINKKDCV